MSELKDKLKEISSKIPKIGRNGKANWIFFDNKTKMNKYIIEVMEGPLTVTYNAYREGNTFYFNYNSPIGVSTIDVRNKRVVSYTKQR